MVRARHSTETPSALCVRLYVGEGCAVHPCELSTTPAGRNLLCPCRNDSGQTPESGPDT